MNFTELEQKGYHISTDKNLLDFDMIYQYLDQESYWAKGIPAGRLRRAIDGSVCFGMYDIKKQIAFARVISDGATFGYICDVFVLKEYRGMGLSKWLMYDITRHPDLQGLRRWSLATTDAHGLYEQFGFTPVSKPDIWMEIYSPYITQHN